ncbi:hypothetical protein JIG36_35520 [Actinoplanes sp. LDG1-06]|uniref:Secreted protein n=1 Tax=Paractinoplanes ovalisporus TaxID=2810368 RepID=A0ABS2AM25_9ACTN|nr:hypothetical protein [Actinoplanes ovalisporus]MBM2620823.1 hypothetical protein [Actinoplanes ovalisporus]
MNIKRQAQAAVAIGAVTAAAVAGLQAPANAAWPSDIFHIADVPTWVVQHTDGHVEWGNRTAYVDGTVTDNDNLPMSSTVIFEAFAGSNKIDTQTRTANEDSSLGWSRSFAFSIGDPDLRGGIDRIKITLRINYPDGSWVNGPTFQIHRDAVAENVGNY